MQIRRATAVDGDAVAYLLRDAFREFERLYTRAGYAATTPDPTAVRERLKEGPTWVAEKEGHVVGTISALLRDGGVYIRSMAVAPGARGQRVGHALMDEPFHLAVERKASRLFLSTTPFLFSAIRLYESLGFRRTGEPPHELHGTPLVTLSRAVADKPLREPGQ